MMYQYDAAPMDVTAPYGPEYYKTLVLAAHFFQVMPQLSNPPFCSAASSTMQQWAACDVTMVFVQQQQHYMTSIDAI